MILYLAVEIEYSLHTADLVTVSTDGDKGNLAMTCVQYYHYSLLRNLYLCICLTATLNYVSSILSPSTYLPSYVQLFLFLSCFVLYLPWYWSCISIHATCSIPCNFVALKNDVQARQESSVIRLSMGDLTTVWKRSMYTVWSKTTHFVSTALQKAQAENSWKWKRID